MTDQEKQGMYAIIEKMVQNLTPEEKRKALAFFDQVSIGLGYATKYHQQRLSALQKSKPPMKAWDRFERFITLEWLF